MGVFSSYFIHGHSLHTPKYPIVTYILLLIVVVVMIDRFVTDSGGNCSDTVVEKDIHR